MTFMKFHWGDHCSLYASPLVPKLTASQKCDAVAKKKKADASNAVSRSRDVVIVLWSLQPQYCSLLPSPLYYG